MNIIDLSKIDLNKIKIKNSILFNNIKIQNIHYDHKPLMIQTPHLYLPFGLSTSYHYEDKYVLNLAIVQTNRKHLKFQEDIFDFEQFLQSISESSQFISESSQFLNSIKQPDDHFYPPCLKTKIHHNVPLQVFDIYTQVQKLNYIIPGSWCTAIIHPKHLWFNQDLNQYGVTWYILQAKVRPPIPILNKCLIEDDFSNETLCSICYTKILKDETEDLMMISNQIPEEYQKYSKMLKLGIPLLAVIQKCRMDGLDPEILNSGQTQLSSMTNHPAST